MADFPPALGLSSERTERVIWLAAMAPSLHNRQPWRFRPLPHSIELHYDPRARLPATDPWDRELRLGCGAALLNLRLALWHEGIDPVTTLLPSLGEESALAEARGEGPSSASPEQRTLYQAIGDRHTNRRPFRPATVSVEQRHSLIEAVTREGCWLHVVERGELGRLAGMVHRAHRAQLADPRFRAEMTRWTGAGSRGQRGSTCLGGGPRAGTAGPVGTA
ncbi:nitroreductase family protein [Actinopolyspora erythraea]|uniref:hypothetical protein n=1 Tax=Actinopolyspora erythraea TaxID=414996 RepID=UPI000B28715B|nr:hypothetical protein [Actinopolyspora erythraea]